MSSEDETKSVEEVTDLSNSDVVTKYRMAAQIAGQCIDGIVGTQLVAGKPVRCPVLLLPLCVWLLCVRCCGCQTRVWVCVGVSCLFPSFLCQCYQSIMCSNLKYSV